MEVDNEKFDEKSCGIVVFREKNNERLYLILHYPSGHFDLPKGHVEDGESEHETALRELEEETGISDVEIITDYRVPISYKYKKKGQPSNKQVVFFLGETATEAVKISHEHLDHFWLPYDAAFNKVTFDNAKNLIKKAERFLG
jgi:8-oxo-dGTP pyrophosphatase MutT (NUDIX family)